MLPINRTLSPEELALSPGPATEVIGVQFESALELQEYAHIYLQTGGGRPQHAKLVADADWMAHTNHVAIRTYENAEHVIQTLEKAATTPVTRWQAIGAKVFSRLHYEPYQYMAQRLLGSYRMPRDITAGS